jgi:hypothetical protein
MGYILDSSPLHNHLFDHCPEPDLPGDLSSLPTPLLPGDLVLFGGKNLISDLIKWNTDKKNHAVSHCAVMISPITLVEATTLNGCNGVAAHHLQDWVDNYPGDIWVRYLTPQAVKDLDREGLVQFLMDHRGEPYSKLQAFLSAIGIETVDTYYGTKRWFCSKLAMDAYVAGGILPVGLGDGITPATLGDLPIFTKAVQVKGKRKDLR